METPPRTMFSKVVNYSINDCVITATRKTLEQVMQSYAIAISLKAELQYYSSML